MPHRCFRYGEVGIRVESDDPGGLEWLAEFLRPSFEDAGDAPCGHRVRYGTDARRLTTLVEAMGSAPGESRACFALDTEVVAHPARRAGAATLLRDERRDVVYRFEGRDVEVAAAPWSEGPRLALLRTVREIAAEAHRRRSRVLDLHAAAWEVGGEAVAFAGEKGAGKTTFLAHALGEAGARYVANDRAFVSLDGVAGRLVVRGMPTVVSLRPGTVERFPALASRVPNVPRPSNLTLAEAESALRVEGRHPAAGRLRLSPALFCAQAGVPAVAAAPLSAVLLGEIDPGVEEVAVEPLGRDAAREGLARCRYGVRSGRAERTAFEDLVGGDAPGDAERLDEVVRRVPVLRCRLGPRAYDRPPSLERLLGAAREAAS